jgi:hypothetical protein
VTSKAALSLIGASNHFSRKYLCRDPDEGGVDGDGRLLDAGRYKARTTQQTSCYRWLNIVGLCIFIGITLYANKEDSDLPGCDVREFSVVGVSNINSYEEPAYYKAIKDASTKYALDPKLIATIIYVESGGNVMAVSPRGAKGLMQLTPVVYEKYDVDDPFDIEQNIFVGAAYLALLLRKFDGNLEHALAAYNCGPARVIEYKGLPPIKETQEYVQRIMDFYLRGEIPTGPIIQES